jgi:2-keto-4-pentenoate hydratase
MLIPLVYVVITIVTVQRSAYGATEAARAAGRAFVLAPDLATASQRAYDAARVAMADQGVPLRSDEIAVRCSPTPQSCLQPGSTVRVEIHLDVHLPLVPSLLGHPAASVAVRATHAEPYGTFREGGQ